MENCDWTFYVRDTFQKKVFPTDDIVTIREVFTVPHKLLEAFVYSFISSWKASFDRSHIVWYQGAGPAIWSIIPKIFGKKVVVTVHSLDWNRKKWSFVERWLFFWLVKLTLSQADTVCVVSKKLRKEIENLFGIKCHIVLPGLPTNHRKSKKMDQTFLRKHGLRSNNYILYVGRIVPEKRINWLLKAYGELKITSHKLVIVGSSNNMPTYDAQLFSSNSNNNIIRIDGVFGEEKFALLRNCSLFVLPSELEGNSIALLEAISQQALCLVTETSVPSDLRQLSYVHTFPRSNYQQFKLLLQKLISGSKRKKALLQKSMDQPILKPYSWQKAARSMEKLFNYLEK